jgi:lipopolysaccharide biosynthesis regulator YciM
MLVRLLLIIILIVISLFCWISLENPVDIEFFFFGESTSISVSALMISSFVLGAILVFISTLTRDAKRAIQEFRKSRQKKKGELIKEELNKGMDDFIRGDFAKAKVHFSEVLKRDPSQIDLYLRLSEIDLKDGKEDEALHWLEQARLIDMRNVTILLREAEVYQRMKRYDDAIRILNRVTGLDENNLKALKNLRGINLESQRWEEAIRLQKLILKLTKGKQADEEETRFYLGLKYEHGRDLLSRGGEEALAAALKEAKEIVREMKTFQPGFVLLGDAYLRMGRWAIAGKVWGKSFMRFKSIIFLLRLEELYLQREDPSTLIRIYQRVLKQNPEQWVIRFYYAKLCLRLEMLDEALDALDEISLRQKDFPALHRLFAETYLHKKDFGRAAQEFEKTFELSGKSFLPFSCTTCERESQEWIPYCPECHQWSTYTIQEGEPTVTLAPRAISEQTHFRF